MKVNRVKNPTWPETNQLAIFKYDREFELGTTDKCLLNHCLFCKVPLQWHIHLVKSIDKTQYVLLPT